MSTEPEPAGAATSSTFERIGGAVAIDRLVEHFYSAMDTLPQAAEIRAMHAADLSEVKRVLKRYFAEWMGGPPLYSSERGHPRLRMRHMGFPIGDRARDAWMLCMDEALGETIPDEGVRADIRAAMLKLADWMRNKAD